MSPNYRVLLSEDPDNKCPAFKKLDGSESLEESVQKWNASCSTKMISDPRVGKLQKFFFFLSLSPLIT